MDPGFSGINNNNGPDRCSSNTSSTPLSVYGIFHQIKEEGEGKRKEKVQNGGRIEGQGVETGRRRTREQVPTSYDKESVA